MNCDSLDIAPNISTTNIYTIVQVANVSVCEIVLSQNHLRPFICPFAVTSSHNPTFGTYSNSCHWFPICITYLCLTSIQYRATPEALLPFSPGNISFNNHVVVYENEYENEYTNEEGNVSFAKTIFLKIDSSTK